ncbi:MAG: sterol desaturase family protein, partial [Gammaproteobacteria bacterium]|nr:sterol desaturase family protein [Gammaproteobacteria bacterium]
MRILKVLAWWLSFVAACGLIITIEAHGQLDRFTHTHHGVGFVIVLGLLLAIPARVIGVVAAFVIELLLVGWERSALRSVIRPSASVRLDMLSVLVMLLLPQRWLGYLLSFGLLFLVNSYLAAHVHLSATHLLTAWGLQIAALVVLQSLVSYWLHRLEHAVPALWALHQFHHSADRMTLMTSARGTQFLKGIEMGIVFVPMALLTQPTLPTPAFGTAGFVVVVAYFIYHIAVSTNGYLAHSNLDTDYGWVGRWLIVSPHMHRLHHATEARYHDKNFGNDVVIWDRLFGTYVRCDPTQDPASVPIGLEQNPFNRRDSLLGSVQEYFITTLVVFWRELNRGRTAS